MTCTSRSITQPMFYHRSLQHQKHQRAKGGLLLGRKSQEVVGIYWKPLSKTVESFTSPSIKGKKYLDRKVYLLTSKDTVSAAEALCYNMKNLKLATVVGEVTAGAANPGSMKRIDDHFSLFLPTGRAVDPVTGKNWEGAGVT